ncbi:ATPase family associated with various cellular activities-domain-containing protein [Peziza echinospora]|nr:ATPase family associated with various cellular activities-domain-containing protein [Peziza echinospora]
MALQVNKDQGSTGKTSLCRALAQKLSIRLTLQYSHVKLVEIRTHDLFSKYFSETGKQIGKVFDTILAMLEDEDTFALVLIDEVESIASARTGMAGNEPKDSLRAVNALLTAFDKLRYKKNLLLTNISWNLIQYVGTPTVQSCYDILQTTFNELIKRDIISEMELLPCSLEASLMLYSQPHSNSSILWNIAESCATQKASGRALRRLPVVLLADSIQGACSIGAALEDMKKHLEVLE